MVLSCSGPAARLPPRDWAEWAVHGEVPDHRAGGLGQAGAVNVGPGPQLGARRLLYQAEAFHEQALGPLHQLALLKGPAQIGDLALQLIDALKALIGGDEPGPQGGVIRVQGDPGPHPEQGQVLGLMHGPIVHEQHNGQGTGAAEHAGRVQPAHVIKTGPHHRNIGFGVAGPGHGLGSVGGHGHQPVAQLVDHARQGLQAGLITLGQQDTQAQCIQVRILDGYRERAAGITRTPPT